MNENSNGSRPHGATVLYIALVVLGVLSGGLATFAKWDRDAIKTTATTALDRANQNDKDVALLKQALEEIKADTQDLKEGQGRILAKLERLPVRAPKGDQ